MSTKVAGMAMFAAIAVLLFGALALVVVNAGPSLAEAKWPPEIAKQGLLWSQQLLEDAHIKPDLVNLFTGVIQFPAAVVGMAARRRLKADLDFAAKVNRSWYWVSVVRAPNGRVLRVKRGTMEVNDLHDQDRRRQTPETVIYGNDVEVDGAPLDAKFTAKAILVGRLTSPRVVFEYTYEDAARQSEWGISHLTLHYSVERSVTAHVKAWFGISRTKLTHMTDRFATGALPGTGEASYFRTIEEADEQYQADLAQFKTTQASLRAVQTAVPTRSASPGASIGRPAASG